MSLLPRGSLPRAAAVLAACCLLVVPSNWRASPSALGGEWPQILGPHRSGAADQEKLANKWPADGPKVAWRHKVGAGYAGPAVATSKVVIFHRLANEEVLEALDAASGRQLWEARFPTRYESAIAPDDGPRCVPLIHNGRVIAVGAAGTVHCVQLASGEALWSRDVYKDFDAPQGYFGAGSTPVAEGERVLMNVGGKQAGLAAFALADGKPLWKVAGEQASYSSPTLATIDGARHAIFVTRFNVVSVDPASGKERFRFAFGQRGPTVNAATPLVLFDRRLFVSASYGIGAVFSEIGKQGIKELWASDEIMSSQYTTCVFHGDHLYGIHGRQDAGPAVLRCIEPRQGKVLWSEEGFGTGHLILADDKLVIVKTDGEVVLANASTEKFERLATARMFQATTQALPALADGHLVARDTTTLKSIELKR